MSTIADAARRHLLIAGTGRAGTSFLVRYFHEVGLETHLTRSTPWWSDSANAGLEDFPFPDNSDLPHVIKSPWTANFIEQVLRSDIKIDAVFIPVRDLRDAASSRCITEYCDIYSKAKWMLSMDQTWDEWGVTPGGVLYSLDPVDQERLLAVKFARLVQALVKANVPMVFLDFPRIVQDAEYLFGKVQAYLPTSVDLPAAIDAHRRVADSGSVRVSKERKAAHHPEAIGEDPGAGQAKPARERSSSILDRELALAEADLVALRREIARSKTELRDADSATRRCVETENRLRGAEEETQRAEERARAAEAEIRRAEERAGAAEAEIRRAEESARAAEAEIRRAEERARQAEDRTRIAEEQTVLAEERTRHVEERVGLIDDSYRELRAHAARLEDTVSRLRRRTLKGIVRRVFAKA